MVSAVERIREKEELLPWAAVCESWELSLSEVILLLHVFLLFPFSISNNMDSLP
jgi:hypothetical protein